MSLMIGTAEFYLVILFLLTIVHLLTLKMCSDVLDHRTAPLFIGGWTLIGLLVTAPVFGHLLLEALPDLSANAWLLALIALKGVLLYLMFVAGQDLAKVSLSTRQYVTPLSIGLIAIVNAGLGEQLSSEKWLAALGLCALAGAFLLLGHAAELTRQARLTYAKLVALVVATAAIDQAVLSETSWYPLLLGSNLVLIALALGLSVRHKAVLRAAAFHPMAIAAGMIYAVTELFKFYQMVDINEVTTVVIAQSLTKPVILLLSAYIWKERTLKEQLVWGVLAFAVSMPMIIKFN